MNGKWEGGVLDKKKEGVGGRKKGKGKEEKSFYRKSLRGRGNLFFILGC